MEKDDSHRKQKKKSIKFRANNSRGMSYKITIEVVWLTP